MKLLITFDDGSTFEPEHWAMAWLQIHQGIPSKANWDTSHNPMELEDVALLGYSLERVHEEYNEANQGIAQL